MTKSPAASGPERTGCPALSIFTRALRAEVLRAHADGPLSSGELEERLGWAAAASLRVAGAELHRLGALERRGLQPVVMEMTGAGRDLLEVAYSLERWLSASPLAPLALSDERARGSVRALVAGWESTVAQALAERSRRLAELSGEITTYSYPTLKRRLSSLRSANLVECVDDRARSPAYEATPLLRRAAGPLCHAARWERRHARALPLRASDLVATLFLVLPLVELPTQASGRCALVALAGRKSAVGRKRPSATVDLVIEQGKVTSLKRGDSSPRSWAAGVTDAWLDTITAGRLDGIRAGGPEADLSVAVIGAIHGALP